MKNKSHIYEIVVVIVVVTVIATLAILSKLHTTNSGGFIETGVPEVTQQISGITPDRVEPAPLNLTTLSGKTYRHFSVQKVYADGVLIRHEVKPGDLSLASVKFADLDRQTKKQLGVL